MMLCLKGGFGELQLTIVMFVNTGIIVYLTLHIKFPDGRTLSSFVGCQAGVSTSILRVDIVNVQHGEATFVPKVIFSSTFL